ncbi:unnamed protein product [Soboliphyme baturini]|uniref:Uncharacterized protein n=1 Tax=Soboliphyme baturini TaxID=241478 RepID=A0A183IXX6_9BILA|nr:unnamed protein product [Soboliphyme baturini]
MLRRNFRILIYRRGRAFYTKARSAEFWRMTSSSAAFSRSSERNSLKKS